LINSIKTVKIKSIVRECSDIKAFSFEIPKNNIDISIEPKPGQFIMVWVPGVDEVPMSISGCNDRGDWSFMVKSVGECTNALFNLKVGDYIGIRGPYGTYFSLPSRNIEKAFLVGGGTGIAPLNYLAKELTEYEIKTVIIEGAKIAENLIINDNINKEISEIFYCTDDGSYGQKGFASETFEKVINEESMERLKKIQVYTCGPEKMMYKVFQICEQKKIQIQASLERMMRCGCGLCGLCAVDPTGLLVCKDGPVFDSKTLREMEDFGKYKRDMTGKKISL
jgi:dihydroorotate dehydrogenase electron transfer subunit